MRERGSLNRKMSGMRDALLDDESNCSDQSRRASVRMRGSKKRPVGTNVSL